MAQTNPVRVLVLCGLTAIVSGLVALVLLTPTRLSAQWSAQAGQTVQNAFGPPGSMCRGACGPGCASTCTNEVRYACVGASQLHRTEIYSCGTHLGCRTHDDCLDRCAQANAAGVDCNARCHLEAVQAYGVENATSWVRGGGPYEGDPIVFEYTRDAPNAPEPLYRCPDGAQRDCAGTARCVAPGGAEVEPVFDAFPSRPGALGVTGFRSGRFCGTAGGARVCEETVAIQVTGNDTCDQGGRSAPCTRFGFEFDYRGAKPASPLVCSSTSSDRQDDFLGSVVAKGITAMPTQDRSSDLGAVLGGLQDALRGGQSLTDVLSGIKVTPLGPDGKPAGPRLGGVDSASAVPPPLPGRVNFTAVNGHLVVPMYALHDPRRAGEVVVQEVTCSYSGIPVLETRFRLQYGG